VLGVLALQQLPQLPSWPWLAALGLLLLAALRHRQGRGVAPLAAACFGFLWASLYAHAQLTSGLEPELEGQELLLVGEVASLPQQQRRRIRFLFRTEQATLHDQAVSVPKRLRLAWYNDYPSSLAPGQRWRLRVKLKRPWGMMNPGGFDYEAWLFAQGIRATGYVRRSAENRLLEDAFWRAAVERARHALSRRLQQVLGDHPSAGLVRALALGERSGISDAQWQVLLQSGTNHLVAISGLHVGLVAGLVFFLGQLLWRRCARCCLALPAPKAAAVAALLAATGYAALAGFSLPTQRAMLMLIAGLGAVLWQRPLSPLRALTLALWAVLLGQPTAVLSAGFWLSFCAVAIILFAMAGRFSTTGLWWRWGRVQVVVALGLLPLLLLFFARGSLSAPLANLLAVPMVGFAVVPLTLLGTLLLPVWDGGSGFLLWGAAELWQWLWPLLELMTDHLPMLTAAAPAWSVVPAMLGVIVMLMPRGWPLRSAGALLLLPLLLLRPVPPAAETAEVTLLDVGQGLSAVVRTRHHALVFDTGPRYLSGFNTGDAVVLPFLQAKGAQRLDMLIVSHGDNDHIGGARALLQQIETRQVLTSVPQKMSWVAHQRCQAGQQWRWDGVEFRLLHPPVTGAAGRGNNDSCVLKVSAGGQSVLLPGDIEREAERQLLEDPAQLKADVLVAPHHGSKTSSSEPFVRAVKPEWVLYPVGYRNRYGFPRPEVAARYRRFGIKALESYRSGAITFTLGLGDIEPQAYRSKALRYWHSR
jgi:competence protein ComEC